MKPTSGLGDFPAIWKKRPSHSEIPVIVVRVLHETTFYGSGKRRDEYWSSPWTGRACGEVAVERMYWPSEKARAAEHRSLLSTTMPATRGNES